MCHHCVTEKVKERMLSRRSFFKSSSAVGLSVAAATVATTTGLPNKVFAGGSKMKSEYVDMTHTLTEDFPTYFGAQQFFVEKKFTWDKNKFNLDILTVNEHTGTHMDAPLHFSKDGLSVDEISVDNLIVPLVVVDIREKAYKNPDAQITPNDIKAWKKKHGDLPQNCCVAMNSGWDKYVKTKKFRNADEEKVMHFPGFHNEAADMLLESEVAGIAVDTLSLDNGVDKKFSTHYNWLGHGRWGLECIKHLSRVPAKGATLVVGAPKHAGGTGGPSRVFAII